MLHTIQSYFNEENLIATDVLFLSYSAIFSYLQQCSNIATYNYPHLFTKNELEEVFLDNLGIPTRFSFEVLQGVQGVWCLF